jgi:hypothetical protein
MEFKKLIVGESFYNRLGVRFRLCNQAARMFSAWRYGAEAKTSGEYFGSAHRWWP